ncbi:MAG: tRNA 4-thiouridine(8) synthase ThiI [Candidatus Omnitrophota bacterium]|nr:tRNA 4-thiouridine(8) synthase ThiI [Candidatus Omnitrophota bacterium]
MKKALVLFSGGLDSLIALRIIKDSGIELLALNFVSPFCRCNRKDGCSAVLQLKKIGVDFRVFSLKEEYLEIVKKPKFGYGSNINPCLDCRVMMFKRAKEVMKDVGASFIITGEVLGQRPMSQRMRQLELIEKETGLSGLILRPLSAKLMPETIPEKEGWVKREILLDLSGRIRSPQIGLAREFGITDYPCPSGGCLLTDPEFSRRIKDLMKHNQFTLDEIELLKLGRHFRINEKLKLVVGRNERENLRLLDLAREDDICFSPLETTGPTAIARGLNGKVELEHLCAAIVARYCDKKDAKAVSIEKNFYPAKEKTLLSVQPIMEDELDRLRI